MVALLGASLADAEQLAGHHGLVVANDNAPGQVVLSGPSDGLGALAAEARERGLRALALDVAGAFHSPAMAGVVEPFRAAVAAAGPRPAVVPVVSGLTAEPFGDVAAELAGALVAPVRWRDVMARLVAMGAEDFVDVGPGRVVARLADRNLKELRVSVA
jgi:[acyl-carrier-protein] S-malonyltransferase